MDVRWARCGGRYCPLETVDLSNVEGSGVYVIWHDGSGRVVFIGQGEIAARVSVHSRDQRILAHKGDGSLLVTWAMIPSETDRIGVVNYLSRLYDPIASSVEWASPEVSVNLPGS